MKASYDTQTKQVITLSSVEEFRCIGIAIGIALGGPPLAQHLLEGVVNAAENTSNDEDYKDQVESFFTHVRDEHMDKSNSVQGMLVDILEQMAQALPRQIVIAEHYRQMGQDTPESFNA